MYEKQINVVLDVGSTPKTWHIYMEIFPSLEMPGIWNSLGTEGFVLSRVFVFETVSLRSPAGQELVSRPGSDSQIQLPLPKHAEITGVPTTQSILE